MFLGGIDYGSIILLMGIESSFIPFPSELIIPPAAYMAANGGLNIYLVVLSGVLGSVLGALFNYFLAFTLGRKIIYYLSSTKLAKVLFISPAKIQRAEDYFLTNGNISTFLGRLIAVVRQWISIPAGLAKMRLDKFILFTALGSALWCSILGALGYFFGANRELWHSYSRQFSWIGLGIFLVLVFIYIFRWQKNKKKF